MYLCFEKPVLDRANDFAKRRFMFDGVRGRA